MSISSIKKALKSFFQGKLKNLVSLDDDSNLSSLLKPLKIGDKNTPLKISEDKLTYNDKEILSNQHVGDGSDSGHVTIKSDNDLIIEPTGGDVTITSANLSIENSKRLYLDGGDDTYITQTSGNRISITAGGVAMLDIRYNSTGNRTKFVNSAAGFTQFEPTYNASDTNVNFNDYGNKAFATFGAGNITDMNLYFPDCSCNCVLLLKQDGTGSRTVTNWKTFDQADGNESTVVWAGGSAPTLTTDTNHIDIISFYWDNDNHKAYGVATLNFPD